MNTVLNQPTTKRDKERDTSTPALPADVVPTLVDDLHPPVEGASEGPHDRAVLTLLTGAQAGMVVSVPEGEIVIGRGEGAEVRIADDWLSRRHARIGRRNDGIHVEDLASKNGTFIGQDRVFGSRRLESGDHLRLGRGVVLRFALVDALEEQTASRLYESSVRDAMTGAFNRRHFEERLTSELAFSARHGSPVSVILIDVDDFKRINDAFGHAVGDNLLRVISKSIERILRPEDLLARYGGDEFAVMVRGVSHRNAAILGERMRRAVEVLPMSTQNNEFTVTVSVGIASSSSESNLAALVAAADFAMYRAKLGGRNRVESA